MTGPSKLPAGWHARSPLYQALTTDERVVEDDAPDPVEPNRAARRTAARAMRRANTARRDHT